MIDQGIPFTPELLAAVRKMDAQDAERRDELEIWPDMAPGVLTFMSMQTQWLHHPMGGLLGLNYQAIRPTADLLCLALDDRAFHDIRIMEQEVLRTVRRQ